MANDVYTCICGIVAGWQNERRIQSSDLCCYLFQLVMVVSCAHRAHSMPRKPTHKHTKTRTQRTHTRHTYTIAHETFNLESSFSRCDLKLKYRYDVKINNKTNKIKSNATLKKKQAIERALSLCNSDFLSFKRPKQIWLVHTKLE